MTGLHSLPCFSLIQINYYYLHIKLYRIKSERSFTNEQKSNGISLQNPSNNILFQSGFALALNFGLHKFFNVIDRHQHYFKIMTG